MKRFEYKRISAVPKFSSVLKLLYGLLRFSRSFQSREKADVLREEMRKCTLESAGIWGQTSSERLIEITLGRTYYQQGLVVTCKD